MGKLTDITMPLAKPMRGFSKTVAKEIGKDGWNASTFSIYSHAGTHMDAPVHFDVNDQTIDEIPIERFICQARIVRLKNVPLSYLITMDDLGSLVDEVEAGEAVIFHTGWSKFHSKPSIYRDKLPRIGKDVARWIVEKRINLVGVEPPSIADINNMQELQEIHRILFEGDVLILEGLCNLEAVVSNRVKLIALPLNVTEGDGAPVRAIIIED